MRRRKRRSQQCAPSRSGRYRLRRSTPFPPRAKISQGSRPRGRSTPRRVRADCREKSHAGKAARPFAAASPNERRTGALHSSPTSPRRARFVFPPTTTGSPRSSGRSSSSTETKNASMSTCRMETFARSVRSRRGGIRRSCLARYCASFGIACSLAGNNTRNSARSQQLAATARSAEMTRGIPAKSFVTRMSVPRGMYQKSAGSLRARHSRFRPPAIRRAQLLRGLRDQPRINLRSRRAAKKRLRRLVLAHFARQLRLLSPRHVRRIADDQIEARRPSPSSRIRADCIRRNRMRPATP